MIKIILFLAEIFFIFIFVADNNIEIKIQLI